MPYDIPLVDPKFLRSLIVSFIQVLGQNDKGESLLKEQNPLP